MCTSLAPMVLFWELYSCIVQVTHAQLSCIDTLNELEEGTLAKANDLRVVFDSRSELKIKQTAKNNQYKNKKEVTTQTLLWI